MFFIVSNRLGNIAAPRKRNVPSSTSHTTHVLYHPIPGRGASGCLPKSGFRTPSWLEFRYFDPVRYLGPSPSSPDKSQQMLVCPMSADMGTRCTDCTSKLCIYWMYAILPVYGWLGKSLLYCTSNRPIWYNMYIGHVRLKCVNVWHLNNIRIHT